MEYGEDVVVDGTRHRLVVVETERFSSCAQCSLLRGNNCHDAVLKNNDCFKEVGEDKALAYKIVIG